MRKIIKALLYASLVICVVFIGSLLLLTSIINHDWFGSSNIQAQSGNGSNSKRLAGNKIELLINGTQSLERRTKNIQEADVILIKTFEFHDDAAGNALVTQLQEKVKAGAKVFIEFDVKGTRHSPAEINNIEKGKENPIPKVLLQLANRNPRNVFIIPSNTPTRFFDYFKALLGFYTPNDHEKYLITWNSRPGGAPVKIIMGGLNIGDEYMFGGRPSDKPGLGAYRDTDIEVIGPVAQEILSRYLQSVVLQAKNNNAYTEAYLKPHIEEGINVLHSIVKQINSNPKASFPNLGKSNARFIAKEAKQNDIEKVLIESINDLPSNTTFRLITPFFLPSTELQNTMLNASNRGITFKILTNSAHSNKNEFNVVAQAAHCRFRYLLHHASPLTFQFYEWQGNHRMGIGNLHEKVFSLGSDLNASFIIGSSNLDEQSLKHNSEDILIVQDPILKKQFDAMMDNDFHQTKVHLLTQDELENEPLLKRLHECGYDWFFHSVL